MKVFYENDLIQIYNDDCQNVMPLLRVDKIITSPPYNIIRPNSEDRGYDLYKDGVPNEEYVNWTIKNFEIYDKIINKNGAIIYNLSYGTENTTLMSLVIAEIIKKTNFTLADILIWKKFSATPNNVSSNKMTRIVEFVYIFCRKEEFQTFTSNKKIIGKREDTDQAIYENVFNFFTANNNDESQELNKATFSTDFVENIIERYILKTDVVLDNFSGTGTTLIACANNGIKSIGIELSKAQCEYAVNRIKKGISVRLF
jgi:DNA modification methylase